MSRDKAIGDLAVAMPSDGMRGDGSAYVPHQDLDAESWIIDDVPACVQEIQPSVRLGRIYLAGQSMGGYGALRLGAKYANRVAGISAHSPVTGLVDLSPYVQEPLTEYERAGKRDTDVLYWMRRNRDTLPPLRFDCGTSDPLLTSSRALHAALKRERIAHSYEELPGGHDWLYWQENISRTLTFVSGLASVENRDGQLIRETPEASAENSEP